MGFTGGYSPRSSPLTMIEAPGSAPVTSMVPTSARSSAISFWAVERSAGGTWKSRRKVSNMSSASS
jgi:hypothetical protein